MNGFAYGFDQLEKLNDAQQSATKSASLAMVQYKSGETDFTTVLNTEQAQLNVEDAQASVRGNVVISLINIYRALGGGWEIRSEGDVISEATRQQMAERTHWGKLLEEKNHLPASGPEENPYPDATNK